MEAHHDQANGEGIRCRTLQPPGADCLFFIFEKTFVILIDEHIRWCLVEPVVRKTAEEWMKVVFPGWIRYFGRVHTLVTDQEGASLQI